MTQIISLLIMALNLLTAIQANPNLPPSFKQSAVEIANYAIKVSQEAMKNPVPVTSQQDPVSQSITPVPPVVTSPTLGAIPESAPIPVPVVPVDKSDIVIKVFGHYDFNVSVLDKEGNYVKGALVIMKRPDDARCEILPCTEANLRTKLEKYTGDITSRELNDYHAYFSYIPTTLGTKTLTFTSGVLTKSITLEVN